jgi:glutaredoxin-like protein
MENNMLKNIEGQRVPNVTFKTRKDHEWVELSSADVFSGKSVVLFSLPGAFTPTCSSSHVPRYNQLQPLFADLGIDSVICVSVNDAFVMDEWSRSQHADRVSFLPDGNGDFTAGMGLLVDKNDLGFGKRSWRYSMLVRDGVVEKMFIEADEPGDPFLVSDADTMLNYLDPAAKRPLDVSVFSRPGCPHCSKAKSLLHEAGIEFEELVLNKDYTDRTLRAVADATSYPQVFVAGQHIGGAEELEAWLAKAENANRKDAA